MPKIPDCDRCQLYAHTPHLVCAVHPADPDGDICLDYAPVAGAIAAEADEMWFYAPNDQTPGEYAGEVIQQMAPYLTRQERLELLDWHPLFTGRCPRCGVEVAEGERSRVHWDCDRYGWMDDTI